MQQTVGAMQRTVAIVDDDPHISEALGLWVELQGLRALHFTSAEALLSVIHEGQHPLTVPPQVADASAYALVGAILDLNLPGMSGIGLSHLLHGLDAELPQVIVTALREDERGRYGPLPAGVPCLKKPFDLDAIESALFSRRHPPAPSANPNRARP